MDSETKEILLDVCEMLKEQIAYSSAVHKTMTALARTILAGEPQLKHRYENQWRQLAFLTPESDEKKTDAHILKLDEIIRRLKP